MSTLQINAINDARTGRSPSYRPVSEPLIVADANLQAYRVVHQKTVPLQAYVDRTYLQQGDLATPETRLWTYLSAHAETTVASALLAISSLVPLSFMATDQASGRSIDLCPAKAQ